MASVTSFWCFYCQLFTPFSSVSIVDFEQKNVSYEAYYYDKKQPLEGFHKKDVLKNFAKFTGIGISFLINLRF